MSNTVDNLSQLLTSKYKLNSVKSQRLIRFKLNFFAFTNILPLSRHIHFNNLLWCEGQFHIGGIKYLP